VSGRVLSIILLPTLECNVKCDYCFEEKSKIKLSMDQVTTLAHHLVDHMKSFASTEANLYWQGGEVMLLGPAWFEQTGQIFDRLAEATGYTFNHYLQTNLIGWNEGWNNVVHSMFDSALGTSMDYPNSHRRLKNGSTEQYTRLWLKAVKEAQSAGIDVGLIAVLHQDTLNSDPVEFYRFFTETAGIGDFQVNMPFPGGPNEGAGTLEVEPLTKFLLGLLEVWLKEGRDAGIKLGPFSELIEQFAGRPTNLPCIWQPNCANEFLAVDARGQTALCDCWVTSYPQHSFGNVFATQNIAQMLRGSEARERFKERPGYLIENTECRTCEWLSMCHGGCPVRTFTAKETIYAKDPYCEVYKAIFGETRRRGRGLTTTPPAPLEKPKVFSTVNQAKHEAVNKRPGYRALKVFT
jgi:radical SAM protein with 4Fe4S-binding SPASM domain